MSWKNIRLIFLREVRDQLRDRRTLFMVAILPMLLYPALGIGMFEMSAMLYEQVGNVVILGTSELMPESGSMPVLYAGDQFLPTLFSDPSSAEKLHVTTDESLAEGVRAIADQERLLAAQSQIETINRLAEVVRQRRDIESVLTAYTLAAASGLDVVPAAPSTNNVEVAVDEDPSADLEEESNAPIDPVALQQQVNRLLEEEDVIKAGLTDWFLQSDIQVLVVIPGGFADSIHSQTRHLVDREQILPESFPHPIVLQNSANEKSQTAYGRVREAIDNWEHLILQGQLSAAGLPASIDKPVDPTRVDLAQGEQIAANFFSKLFPTLLVAMALTGAFYPAIDLGAGEKERGTMETLLICPATRTEIVLGKFFTVMLFSISTAMLNLACMGMTGSHIVSLLQGRGGPGGLLGDASIPPFLSLVWLVILAIPLSALFSSLSLAFAMLARSSKEGQYYLTPLLVTTMGLAFYCLYPGVELDPFKSVMPVLGPALLLKSLLLAQGSVSQLLVYAIPVLLSSVAYCALALWWAIELFSKESVLFREAERFDLRLWVAHIFRDKDAMPSFTEAAFCIVMILLLQFAAMPFLSRKIAEAILTNQGSVELLRLQTIYLIATVGTPAVMMGILLTSRVDWTLKLRLPSWQFLLVGMILPFTLQPISVQLQYSLQWFFPPLPQGVEQMLQAVSDKSISIWWPILAFAIAPAICEELAFRGFILSGLQRSGRNWLAIMISAVVFGLIHMIPQQQFNGALLGIVLGLLAVRSGSLLPAVLFHFINNGLQVAQSRLPQSALDEGVLPMLFHVEESGLRAQWPVLLICIALSAILITWLVKQPSTQPEKT